MNSILDKDIITEQDIESLITLGVEESINLDYKASDSLEINEGRKTEIAKDISAFANSAGGYIIYGMNERDHKASSLSPIDGSIITKEWLEQVIQTRIQRKLEGLIISPIRIQQDIKKTIYVVKIPESSLAPHMTSNKKFYKRYNFESVQMEEYEVRNLYNRKEKTKLVIDNIVTATTTEKEGRGLDSITYWKLSFQIQNIGKAVEKDYKLTIGLNFRDYSIKFDPLRNDKNFNHSVTGDNFRVISFFGVSAIFPDEVLTIGHVDFGLLDSTRQQTIEKGVFRLRLLYTNGVDEMKIELGKVLKTSAQQSA